jgi:hypothetical protein
VNRTCQQGGGLLDAAVVSMDVDEAEEADIAVDLFSLLNFRLANMNCSINS